MIIYVSDYLRVNCVQPNYNIETRRIAPRTIKGGKDAGKPNPNAGEITWVVEGHYPSIQTAFKSEKLLSLFVRDSIKTTESLEEVVAIIRAAETSILKAVDGLESIGMIVK